jgi:hypothetical protein
MPALSKTTMVLALYMYILWYVATPKACGGLGFFVGDFPTGATTTNRMKTIVHGIAFVLVFMLTSGYVVKLAG